jgi:hypothetical protein
MLYSEIIAVCSQIHTEHINTLCGHNAEFFNVKFCGSYSNHWAVKLLRERFNYMCNDTTPASSVLAELCLRMPYYVS